MNKFKQLQWMGSIIAVVCAAAILGLIYGLIVYTVRETSTGLTKKTEVVHDTVRIEVVKEVEVPCTLPHARPVSVKPVVKPEIVENNDTVH